MFELRNELKIEKGNLSIQHGDSLLFLGSCFSNEIGARFKNAGFKTLRNSFGTIFHPKAIFRLLDPNLDFSNSIFQRNDVFLSWLSASTIYNTDKYNLLLELIKIHEELHKQLKTSKVIFLTFGTSWEYFHLKSEITVANCHKENALNFEKRLTPLDQLINDSVKDLQLIIENYPQIQIVLTVSPVRHLKDGMIENNRSKARLIEMVHSICAIFSNRISYFPSYELVVDDLRDYRFFEKDGIHPNDLAIDYVWFGIKKYYFGKSTIDLVQKVENARTLLNHKTIQTDTEESKKLEQKKSHIAKEMMDNNLIFWEE